MKKPLISLAALIVVAAVLMLWFVNRTPSSPFDGRPAAAEPSAEMLAQGEYVARTADCVACHSLPGKAPFSGGLEMGTPLGSIYATNITPDPKHGIGNYSLAEFDRAVRDGVAQDGHRLYPAMPYPSYQKLSDADVAALYAYFMHAVKPAPVADKPSGIPYPMNMRWPLALWNLAFARGGAFEPVAGQSAEWNRGAYLVEGPGHCGSCHTPRSLTMAEKARDSGSDAFLSGALLDGWYAPSLRQDPNTGLGRWSEADIAAFLKQGRNVHAVVFGSMAEAFNNSTQFMSDDDLRAIAVYLKSLPGDPGRDGTPWAASGGDAGGPGAPVYAAKCAFCHGPAGQGQAPWIPALAGAASAHVDAASQINVTLNGSARVVADGVPDSYRMPPLRDQLSDSQIADVLNYVRQSWGNAGNTVDPKDVAALRARTDPASPNPIVLQMR